MTAMQNFLRWKQCVTEDPELMETLEALEGDEREIYECFYRNLTFGTGGMRGILGVGSNRMNIYTVRHATQGLASYVLKIKSEGAAVAISFDSRRNSERFAREAARVLAGNGIKVFLFSTLNPTPVLSFAVRELHCEAGIMITASHNPAQYNGYKCYGADGCQMTDGAAGEVMDCIESTDIFKGVCVADFDEAVKQGLIVMIGDEVTEAFLDCVAKQQVYPGVCRDSGLRVIYTPLNGTGNLPVRAILKRIGVTEVTVVPEQELPDGSFATAPYPNPEIREAFDRALKLAESVCPDLLLATDPDCDRVGIAVRQGDDYRLMTGNEVGCLLADYILSGRQENGTLPAQPVLIKTIVTSELVRAIAAHYGAELRDVLTGFKYIGEQIGLLEKDGQAERFVLGFEESYGYLSGSHVRDKDAVVASMLIVEMAAYYKKQGRTLVQVLDGLYEKYGFYRQALVNAVFEGAAGMEKMEKLMADLRATPPTAIAGRRVTAVSDYWLSVRNENGELTPITLPKSNVLSFTLEGDAGVIVRPSGTESKIKAYITVKGQTAEDAEKAVNTLFEAAKELLK